MQGVDDLANSSVARRVTQPNGLALLVLFVLLTFWMVFGR